MDHDQVPGDAVTAYKDAVAALGCPVCSDSHVTAGLAAAYPHLVAPALETLERLKQHHEDRGLYPAALAYLGAAQLLETENQ